MEAMAEDHHNGILESVYKAISDSFVNQTVLENQIDEEEQYSDSQADELVQNHENE